MRIQTGVDVPEAEREEVSRRLMEDYSCKPVFISDEIADRHYNGFSNSILWPLFHYREFFAPSSLTSAYIIKGIEADERVSFYIYVFSRLIEHIYYTLMILA